MKSSGILVAITLGAAMPFKLPASGNFEKFKATRSSGVTVCESERLSGQVFLRVAGRCSRYAPGSRRHPIADKKENSTVEKTYSGTLKTGIMAIGAETTGVILETDSGIYELDLRGNPEAAKDVEKLHGKKVIVTGDYRPRPGVEVKERRIIVVSTLHLVL